MGEMGVKELVIWLIALAIYIGPFLIALRRNHKYKILVLLAGLAFPPVGYIWAIWGKKANGALAPIVR